MEWTRDLPTSCGWYWFKTDPHRYRNLPGVLYKPSLLFVFSRPNGPMYFKDIAEPLCDFMVGETHGFWAGPVEPPPDVPDPRQMTLEDR